MLVFVDLLVEKLANDRLKGGAARGIAGHGRVWHFRKALMYVPVDEKI